MSHDCLIRVSLFCLITAQAAAADIQASVSSPALEADSAYEAGDFAKAARIWAPLAQAGDSIAQYRLGLLYDLGQGVTEDGVEAFRWYLKAAMQALPEAEFNVAVMTDGGRFTAQDEAQAAMWYSRAASHGLPRAQYDLAQLYDAGEGVPKNHQAAVEWYSAAATRIPAAASHVASIAPIRPASGDENRALSPPLLYPTSERSLSTHALELAWIEPQQPAPVRYYVSVVGTAASQSSPLFEGYAPASALVVQLPDQVKDCAWRVYAVDVTGARYAASPWQHLKSSE